MRQSGLIRRQAAQAGSGRNSGKLSTAWYHSGVVPRFSLIPAPANLLNRRWRFSCAPRATEASGGKKKGSPHQRQHRDGGRQGGIHAQ